MPYDIGAQGLPRAGKDGVMTVSPFTNVKASIYNDIATIFCLSWEHDGALSRLN